MYILFSLLIGQAHAGVLQWLCDRLIMDNPYQYEELNQDYLERAVKHLEVREAWGKLNPAEVKTLAILRREINQRERIDSLPR